MILILQGLQTDQSFPLTWFVLNVCIMASFVSPLVFAVMPLHHKQSIASEFLQLNRKLFYGGDECSVVLLCVYWSRRACVHPTWWRTKRSWPLFSYTFSSSSFFLSFSSTPSAFHPLRGDSHD